MTKHQKAEMGLNLELVAKVFNTGLPNLAGAACDDRALNPDLFFSEKPDDILQAKAICGTCPVIDTCLNYALRVNEYGVWGGLTAKERSKLRRQLANPVPQVNPNEVENHRLLASSRSAASLARHFNVSPRTIQRWRKEMGLASGTVACPADAGSYDPQAA